MSKIIVLGSSGFLGSLLLNRLVKEQFEAKAMIHDSNGIFEGEKFSGDILNQQTLEDNISAGDIIVNLVGQIDDDISKFIDLNIKGSINLLSASLKKKPQKIIFVSSINVYGDNENPSKEDDKLLPKTLYGLVKALAEKIYENFALVHGFDITILRLANVYGPTKKTGLIHNIIRSINNPDKPVPLYNDGSQLRDFLYVDDAINGIISAVKVSQKGFNTYNISSGLRFSILDVVRTIEKISGKRSLTRLTNETFDENSIWADNSKAKKFLKLSPQISLDEGIKFTIRGIDS